MRQAERQSVGVRAQLALIIAGFRTSWAVSLSTYVVLKFSPMSTMKYLRRPTNRIRWRSAGSRSAGGQAPHTSTSSSSHQSPESGVIMVLDVSKPVRSGTMRAT